MLFFAAGYPIFETTTRNTLDLSCIPVIGQEFHLPIIIYPSHETGHWNLPTDMTPESSSFAELTPLMIKLRPDSFNAYSDNLCLSK